MNYITPTETNEHDENDTNEKIIKPISAWATIRQCKPKPLSNQAEKKKEKEIFSTETKSKATEVPLPGTIRENRQLLPVHDL